MSDLPALIKRFPDAKAIFGKPFADLSEIKKDCLISFDTNVLLAPYKFGQGIGSNAELRAILEPLSHAGRIFITAHVAREFASRRGEHIGNILKTLGDQSSLVRSFIDKTYSCLIDIEQYSSVIKIDKELSEKRDEVKLLFNSVIDQLRDWDKTDPVWDMYRAFFSDVVDIEESDYAGISSEYAQRTQDGMPPGGADAGKDENKEGDLIIWKTLLRVGRDRQRDLIFVTNDEKPDWRTQAAGKPLLARYELVLEFGESSGGKSLHLMTFSTFLKEFGAGKELVVDAERVERQPSSEHGQIRWLEHVRSLARIESIDHSEDAYDERWIEKLAPQDQLEAERLLAQKKKLMSRKLEINRSEINLLNSLTKYSKKPMINENIQAIEALLQENRERSRDLERDIERTKGRITRLKSKFLMGKFEDWRGRVASPE